MMDKADRIKQRYTPMTNAQLRAVVADYAAAFPDWELIHNGLAIARTLGPIRQMLWFQNMRSFYRPTHVINTTALSMPRMLSQIMDVKYREVEHRLHQQKFASTLAAMEREFKPDIRKPLDIAEILALCEAAASTMPDSTNNMTMLAILSAWLGRDTLALDYCERTQNCPLPQLAPMPEWEAAMRDFCLELSQAIKTNSVRVFLEVTRCAQ
jgi:hypothetical protein